MISPANGMVAEAGDYVLKNLGSNLYEVKGGGKTALVRLMPINNVLTGPLKQKFKVYRWKKVYDVSFDGEIQKVIAGDSAKEPESPKKQGYVFSGWDKDFTKINTHLEINSKWQAKKYNIIFMDGKKVLKKEEVEYGKNATPPEMPHEEYRTFLGWDKDLNITSDTVFNAKWKAKEYVVKIDGKEVKVEHMQDVTLPTPQKQGFKFMSWSHDGKGIIEDMEIKSLWLPDDGRVHFLEKVEYVNENIKWVLDNLNKTDRLYGDYNVLQKTREMINKQYFQYYSMLDCSINQENGKFYLEIYPSKDRFDKNRFIEKEEVFQEGITHEEAIEVLREYFKKFTYKEGQHDIYEALKTKTANCDAIARLADIFLKKAGIECRYVTGYVPQGYHAWNKVKINNEWYYIDFTWDTGLGKKLENHVSETEK